MQSITRRTMLSLTGSGMAGAAMLGAAARPSIADPVARVAEERGYRPLALATEGRARIQHIDSASNGRASIVATLDRRAINERDELVITVQVAVANDLVGRQRVLRSMMIGDNGDLRMETVGPVTTIDDPVFELEIALGSGDPIQDWNLIPERIFAARVSLDVLNADDFALSDDFLFKVRGN